MNSNVNKQLMQDVFSALEKGNDTPLLNLMADDMEWTWMGTGQWSKTFKGKASVLNDLWAAVKNTIKPPYKAVAERIMADGDYVVVQASGFNTTSEDRSYNNKYCWVCHFADGKLRSINEYMDTQLVTDAFRP